MSASGRESSGGIYGAFIHHVTGMDISGEMLGLCREHLPQADLIQLDCADPEKGWPELKKDFGFAVSLSTFHFIRDAALVVSRMIEKTARGGIVAFNFFAAPGEKIEKGVMNSRHGQVEVFAHPADYLIQTARQGGADFHAPPDVFANLFFDDSERPLPMYMLKFVKH